MRVSRLATITLVVGLLAAAFALGRLTADQTTATAPEAPASLEAEPPLPQALPGVDVDGTDLEELPRYRGAVRTGHEVRDHDDASVVHAEYLALATVDEVRTFYRQAFVDHGWTVVDLQLAYGELVYLVANGDRDGLVEIESRGDGVVEIDLEVVTPRPRASDSPSKAPDSSRRPATPPAAPSTPSDAGDDEGDDDDGGGDDDGGNGDGDDDDGGGDDDGDGDGGD